MFDTIIIIPYRDREDQLDYFIKNTSPILQKYIPNGKIVVVEQDWNNKFFNRGCLLNIGINEYINKTKYYITHDVDTYPHEQAVVKYYLNELSNNFIEGIYNSAYNTLGGGN